MSTPAVSVPITTLDLTAPGFASATAKLQAFQQQSTYSIRESTAAARLFNDELGTHMSRHLTSLISRAPLLGAALEAALPIAAAVGFFEVAKNIGTALGQWYFHTEDMKAFQERMEETTKTLVKFWAETEHINAETAVVGASAQQKWATELDTATAKVKAQNEHVRNLADTIYKLKQGQGEAMGGGISINGNTKADIPALQDLYVKAVAEGTKLEAERAHAQAELNKAQRDGMDEYAKKIEQATEKAKQHRLELEKILESVEKMVDKMPVQFWSQESLTRTNTGRMPLVAGTDFMASVAEPSDALSKKHIQNLQDQAGWYEATRTAAEKYAAGVTALNAIFVGAARDSDVYRRALKQLKDELDNATKKVDQAAKAQAKAWKEAGRQIEENILQAATMQKSWKAAIQSIIQDLAQLIIKLLIVKALSGLGLMGGGEGDGESGGFMGSFVSGLTGMASGGPVSAGMSYIVGERGAELFTPGRSGSITPNGALGQTIYQDFRGAVVTDDLMRRSEMAGALRVTENRSVDRALAAVNERNWRH